MRISSPPFLYLRRQKGRIHRPLPFYHALLCQRRRAHDAGLVAHLRGGYDGQRLRTLVKAVLRDILMPPPTRIISGARAFTILDMPTAR